MHRTVKEVIADRVKLSGQADAGVEKRVSEWQQAVEGLLATVTSWVPKRGGSGKQLSQVSEIVRSEDLSGSYKIKKLEISIGRSTVELLPVGTWIIGARGRVDLRGPAATVRLIWVEDGAWLVVPDSMNPRKTTPLSEAAFAEALDKVLG